MQRYNIISKLANLSISNLDKHKKIANSPVSLVSLVSPVSLVSLVSLVSPVPLVPLVSQPSQPSQSSQPSLYFRYRKNTGSPKKLLKNYTPILPALPTKFFYLHLFHYFCTLNLKFDNSQIC